MNKKVHILKDDFTVDFYILGISTGESILQLILDLNSAFGFTLKLSTPLSYTLNNSNIDFPSAVYVNDDLLKVQVIRQKIEGKILAKQFPKMDYFLIFSGENAAQVFEKVQNRIKSFPNLSLITPIDSKKIKSITILL